MHPPHLLTGGAKVRHGDAAVSKAGVGPAMPGEDLLRGEARLEAVGRWAPRARERRTQVGLQLDLQVLAEGGTEAQGTEAASRPPWKAKACHGQD